MDQPSCFHLMIWVLKTYEHFLVLWYEARIIWKEFQLNTAYYFDLRTLIYQCCVQDNLVWEFKSNIMQYRHCCNEHEKGDQSTGIRFYFINNLIFKLKKKRWNIFTCNTTKIYEYTWSDGSHIKQVRIFDARPILTSWL